MRQYHLITTTGLLLWACSPFSLLADSSPVADAGSKLRYTDEPVQWIPHSVTVLDQEELETTFRRDLESIESVAPSLLIDRMNTTPKGAAISIRGIGSAEASKGFEPAVAVSVDGVYVGTHTGRALVMFDFERVEVARGPQGIYTGAPNLSGAIMLERTKPTGVLDSDVRVSLGSNGRREFDGVVNFPIVAGLDGKVSGYWKDEGDGYINNAFSDRDENTGDSSLISASFLWKFSDLFTAQYTFDTESSDETTPVLLNITTPTELLCTISTTEVFPNCRRGIANPELDSLSATAQNYSNDNEFDGDYHTLKVQFDFLGHQVTSITGLRSTDESMAIDLDASNANFYHVNREQDYKQLSQEFTAQGEYSDALSYSFGAYLLNTDYEILQQEFHILQQLGDAGFSDGHAAGEIQELASSQDSSLY